MPSTLYRNGVVHSPDHPFAEALLVVDGHVAWLGSEDAASTVLDGADDVVDLAGALVTPGFVDAHVHLLETGLALAGVDLSPARVGSVAAALDAVAAAARGRGSADGPLLGHGWDETAWPEGRPPTRAEVDRAAGGAEAYLARTDVHSAVVSSALAARGGLAGLPGWRDDGLVVGDAHHRARELTRDVPADRHEALARLALAAAARAGVVGVHEHSAPFLDTREGLRRLLALTADPASGLPEVVAYRAELCRTPEEATALLAAVPGLRGIGGDLTVDGSLGSRTAALREPYADAEHRGSLHLSAEQVADHVVAVAAAGAQAAFHAIGDAAADEVLRGLALAAERVGVAAVQRGGHRVEHAEMVDAAGITAFVRLGLVASVQPAFDAAWGGRDGMYARRLGHDRARALNPFAAFAAAGVPLAFGSDSPVTPFDPWGTVRAAMHAHEDAHRVSARAAFRAHTRGAYRAAGATGGDLRLGAPADLAVWEADEMTVQAPDGRLAAWSTDPRSGTPLLPRLDPGAALPRCLRTVRGGVVLHDGLA